MSKKCELLAVTVASGNNVSHSNRKTRRRFLPNLRTLSLHSDVLGVDLTLRIATSTLRTVNKYGNIDSFLVNCRHSKLTDLAVSLRNQVKRKLIKSGKLSEVQVVKEKKKEIVKKEVKVKVAKAS